MRILIVTPHIFAGGAEKVVLYSAQELESMGCQVAVASLSLDLTGLPPKLRNLHFIQSKKKLDMPTLTGTNTAVTSMVKESYELSKLLRKHAKNFDVINPFNFPSYWATFFAQTRKPVVWTCSEVFGPYRQTKSLYENSLLFRLALGAAASVDRHIVKAGVDEIVTYSRSNSHLIMERYGRASQVIPACVDYDFFSETIPNAKEKLGFQGSVLLLHVGWLVPSKNQIASLRALQLVKKKIPNVKLVLVGTGPSEPYLRMEAERLGLKDAVVFTDIDSQEGLRLMYQACDFNLYPVRNQTFGLVPFEVLAAGKLSIVSNDCGAADILENEKIGFLIKPNASELADSILLALSKPELVKDMVTRGQMFVRENLTWKKYAQDMCSVFRKALGSG